MLKERRLPTVSSVTTLPVHPVDTTTGLFSNPVDVSVPSENHPVVPVSDEYMLSLRLLDRQGYAYPVISLDGASSIITYDGAVVFQSVPRDMIIIDGLAGRVALLYRRVKGSVIGDGVGQVTFILPDGTIVLNDTVLLVVTENAPVPVKGTHGNYSKDVLNLLWGYEEPSNDLLDYTFIYMGTDGLLLQGHMYKCALIDGKYVWQPTTPLWVDDERWIEWND